MPYTEVFGGDNIFPSQLSFLALAPVANVTFQWPTEVALPGANVLPDILEVTPAAGLSITLPDARNAGPGQSLLINNVGANTITILNNIGGAVGSVASGEVWEFYLQSNATQAGVWRTFEYGAGASSAVAAALAGAGLKAILTTLNVKILPRSSAVSPLAIVDGDRAAMVQWTGGVGAGTLPAPATLGTDWFTYVRNNGTGTWTITPAAGTIDGSATLALSPFSSSIIYTDGANFFTIGLSRTTPSNFDTTSINVAGIGDYVLAGVELNRISYSLTGILTGARNIITPTTVQQYWVSNETTGAFALTVKPAAGAGVVVPTGCSLILYCDGTDIVAGEGAPATALLPTLIGGTGLATYVLGDVIYASAANVLARLAASATATRYLSNTGAGNIPAWAQINLANGVTGVLPFANITDGSATSVLGRSANSAGVMASIAATLDGQVLRRAGGVLGFGAVDLADADAITGDLPDANLSANVPLKDATNSFSGSNSYSLGNLLVNGFEAGYNGFPFDDDSPHTLDYTLEANDRGCCIFFSAAHGAGDTVTIPSNASGTFAGLGVTVLVINDSATDILEVAIDTDTLYLAGTTTTGPQNILPKGAALLYRTQSTEWIIIPLGQSITYPASSTTIYAGYVDAAVAAEQLPAGWTVSLAGATFTVTHNLGLASAVDLSVTATAVLAAGDDRFATVVNQTVNAFDIIVVDVGAGAIANAFSFLAKKNV